MSINNRKSPQFTNFFLQEDPIPATIVAQIKASEGTI
jgi:hypothetical protein